MCAMTCDTTVETDRSIGRSEIQHSSKCQQFIQGLIDDATDLRLPDLVTGNRQDALYYLPDRGGVSVIALRTTALREDQLVTVLKYRLVQYLLANFVDRGMVYEARMDHEPLSHVSPNDVHIIATSASTGEILCYATLMAGAPEEYATTLRTRDRPLLPVEQVYGWGVYNRLALLPDVPVGRLLELGRFVKNQLLHRLDERVVRAPLEVCVAVHRVLSGPLSSQYEAVVGDVEENVAKRNLDFLHWPTVVIHGTVACLTDDAYKLSIFRRRDHYPFAFLISDLWEALPRLAAIEDALSLPRTDLLRALSVLKANCLPPRSSLEPPGGLAPLNATDLPQRRAATPVRRHLRDLGDRLRAMELFQALSVPEATVVASLLEIQQIAAGEILIHQGEWARGLCIIEAGQADVQVRYGTGARHTVASCGPGDYFGEMALVIGAECTAAVVARTPLTVLELSRETYDRYLSGIPEVQQHVSRTASRRATTLRHLATAEKYAKTDMVVES